MEPWWRLYPIGMVILRSMWSERMALVLRRLTSNTQDDVFPSWNPDGKSLAFSSTATGYNYHFPSQSAIFVIDVDGENRRRLTNTAVGYYEPTTFFNDTQPVWSPTGEKIAFLSDRFNGYREVFLINPDGTDPVQITFHNAHHWNPNWTHDGKRIVFDGRLDGFRSPSSHPVNGIYSIIASGPRYQLGNDIHPIINDTNSGIEYDSAFSPDGKAMLFLNAQIDPELRTGLRGLTFAELIEVNGRPVVNTTKMTQKSEQDQFSPHWSANGALITFTSTRGGHQEVYVMNADGSDERRLTYSRRRAAPD